MQSGVDVSWQTYAHGADVGIGGTGPTLSSAFEQAALAMTATVTDPTAVRPAQSVTIECEAASPDLLLFNWLNAVIYEMATRHMLFGRYSVRINGNRLTATAEGERIDRNRHQPAVEPKGATLTDLQVVQQSDGRWRAQCIVDV